MNSGDYLRLYILLLALYYIVKSCIMLYVCVHVVIHLIIKERGMLQSDQFKLIPESN